MDTDDTRRAPDNDEAATAAYHELIRSLHQEWDELEATGDRTVQLSGSALTAIKESVRADTRHGAAVRMPPTPAGPFTATESAVRTLVRSAVDSVPGARSLRTTLVHAPAEFRPARGLPIRLTCRISASLASGDLLALADQVRTAVRRACRLDLGLEDLPVDIHIEDLHD